MLIDRDEYMGAYGSIYISGLTFNCITILICGLLST